MKIEDSGLRLVLASASPRRAELLTAAGIPFDVIPSDADETIQPGETPEVYAQRVSEAKADAVLARAKGRPILAADTVVVVDTTILTKPVDDADARRMLRLLSGRTHDVLTAVTLVAGTRMTTRLAVTTVEFVRLSEQEIDWYVTSGEPRDKAGGYAIQGYASRFVTRVNGSYSNVVGLPIALVYDMIRSLDD